LNCALMLIPREKLGAVMAVLEQEALEPANGLAAQAQESQKAAKTPAKKALADDPWQDLLGSDE